MSRATSPTGPKVYLSPEGHTRLKELVELTKPKPTLGGMVEALVDQALEQITRQPEAVGGVGNPQEAEHAA